MHGIHLNHCDPLAASNVTLAKILRAAGFQTAAFVGAMPLDRKFGLDQGFDTYDGRFMEQQDSVLTPPHGRGGQPGRDGLVGGPRQGAFFVFLHYYDAHYPYPPHPPYTSRFEDDSYAGEICYIDDCIGRVLEQLRRQAFTTALW